MWCCARRDRNEQDVSIDVKDRCVRFKVTTRAAKAAKAEKPAEESSLRTRIHVNRTVDEQESALTVATLAAHSAKAASISS
jgi:hypothetical protein